MSSCDTQRATGAFGRLVAFIAALLIALTTLFATTVVPQSAIAADDGQTNFDYGLPLRRTSKTSLRPPKKTTMTAITVRLALIFRPRIGLATTRPIFRRSSMTQSALTSRRNCCSNSPILKVLPTSRTKATPLQPKSTRWPPKSTQPRKRSTRTQTSPILRNTRSSVPRKPPKSARSSTRPRRILPKAKATARGVTLPAK